MGFVLAVAVLVIALGYSITRPVPDDQRRGLAAVHAGLLIVAAIYREPLIMLIAGLGLVAQLLALRRR